MCTNTLPKLLLKIIFIIGTEVGSAGNQTTSEVVWLGTPPVSKAKLQGNKIASKSDSKLPVNLSVSQRW